MSSRRHSEGEPAREAPGAGAAKLSMQGLAKSFPLANGESAVAVQDFSLDVREGEFMVLVGPSGCGKTTVLNMLAGLERPSAGTLTLDGHAIGGPGAERGVMFQDYALFPWRTVRENVAFGLQFGPAGNGLSKDERDRRVSRYLDLVRLSQAQAKYPHQLSGGMRQRVALARLMANEPSILLMDEPLAALDAQTRLVLQDELLRIWGQDRPAAERRTVVFITHAIDEAVFLADRVAVMTTHPGRLKTVIEVPLARPRNDGTRALPEFQALCQEIWGLIRAEAVRATMT